MAPTDTCQLSGITKSVRTRTLLDNITIWFSVGVTALLGPNGAGKTTLLRVLATVTRPTAGRIRMLGYDPSEPGERTEIRRRLGYVPQELSFPRGFTVYGFVEYLAVLKELTEPVERRREIHRVLELTDLEDVATEKIHRLSGGTRRRLAVAQAFLGSPELLLLDEPTAGLDPDHRMLLSRAIEGLDSRATIILATQQAADLSARCERVVVLEHGRVTYSGDIVEFVDRAAGRVWISNAADPTALATTTMLDGRFRHVGRPPHGAETTEPHIDDAYLMHRHMPAEDRT